MFRIILLFLGCFLLCCSCNEKRNATHNTSSYFDSVLAIVDHQYDNGNKDKALSFIQHSHASAPSLTLEDEMNYYSYCNAIYLKDLKNYDKCIEYTDTMLQLLDMYGKDTKLTIRRIQAYNNMADALLGKGSFNDAYDYYFLAKTLAKDNADSCSMFAYSYSLGMVSFRQQNYERAAYYFKQSYQEALSCLDEFTYFYRRQELLDNIGLSFGRAKKYDSAMVYYRKAIEYITANKGKYKNHPLNVYDAAAAVVYGNMADVYIAQNQFDTAKVLLNKSIAVNLNKANVFFDAELTQIKLAEIYLKTNDIEPLKLLLPAIRAELDTMPSKVVEMQWNKLMWQYSVLNRDSVDMCRYVLSYLTLKDTLEAKNKVLMTSDIEGRVNSLERQHKILALENEKKQQWIYLIVVLIVAVMAIIIVFLVLRNVRRAQKDVAALTALNNQVIEQNEQLENAFNELEYKDKDKSRILKSVAHDVMSPISAVAALTDMLLAEADERQDNEQIEILLLIKEACSNSISLSKDILEAAVAIDPGKMVLEPIDIQKLAFNCTELLNFRAQEKKQRILFESTASEKIAYVNKEKIWRVINNLIMNAIKFSYEKSDIQVKLKNDGQNIVLSVTDKGIGIPEKNKQNIFDMFTDSKRVGTSGEKPNGIGLSICLQIAKLHGGDIWFDSVEGQGTTFYFSVPLNKDNHQI